MHNFDAVFPDPTTEYVKAIKHINTNTAKNALFNWDDVEENRNQMYDAVSTMLSQYNVGVLSYNHKEELVRKFSNVSKRTSSYPFYFLQFLRRRNGIIYIKKQAPECLLLKLND